MKKKALALLLAASMVLGLTACGGSGAASTGAASDSGSGDAAAADSGSSGDLIKVGIINNDPNESGYRT
ncbi:MAG: sugar ABC transporter substrate-binding protein, partial [Lachnospiraceae bacterium]|nr:sugar ABC transporter substrate-binding protein [Lachnospiraceae bacterium]